MFKKNHTPWNKGKSTGIKTKGFSGHSHSQKSKDKTSESLKKKFSDPEFVHYNEGKLISDILKEKIGYSVSKYWKEHNRSEEQTIWNKGHTKEDTEKLKCMGDKVSKKVLSNPEEIKRRSEMMRLYNLTQKDYTRPWNCGMHPWDWMKISEEEFYRKLTESQKRRPNGLETNFISLIKKYCLPFKYVGDGSLWICGKNPDFIHTENKTVLELFGDYWHKDEDEITRAEHFKSHGFNTIIVWESEIKSLSEEQTLKLILEKLQ